MHSCTVVLWEETKPRPRDTKSLVVVLQPPGMRTATPSSSVKERKLSGPERKPCGVDNQAPVSQLPPLCGVCGLAISGSGPLVPVLSPHGGPACSRIEYGGDGVWENLKCQFASWHAHKLARAKARHTPARTPQCGKPPTRPFEAEAPAWPHCAKCQDMATWADAEDLLPFSLVFLFVFEFIQSLRNLWFWLEI